jgi:Tfp pilus assembly protein PilE
MKNKRGFTLTEMLIYCLLLGVVLTAVYGLFNFSQKSYRITRTMMNLQTDTLMILTKIEAELSETDINKYTPYGIQTVFAGDLENDPEYVMAVIFPSPKGIDNSYYYGTTNDNVLHWQKWIVYYYEAEPGNNTHQTYKLIRKERAINPPVPVDSKEGLVNPGIATFLTGGGDNKKIIAEKVRQFEVRPVNVKREIPPSGGQTPSPVPTVVPSPPYSKDKILSVKLKLDDSTKPDGRPAFNVQSETDVNPRNSTFDIENGGVDDD